MGIFLLILFILFAIINSLVLVIKIAIYGKNLFKPDFERALERLQGNTQIGRILNSNKGFKRSNIIAYYLLLAGWIFNIGFIIFIIFVLPHL